MQPSRREFVKWVTASGIALSMSRLGSAEEVGFATRETLPGRQNWNPAANGAGRIDGVAKVTGTKLYASDFRAADLPGWPATTSHAILVRAPDATHVYTGMDLARLSGALKPSVVVTAEDLAKIGTRVPEFYAGDLFCPVGKTPLYLGQPVALLIFEKFDAFDQARLALLADDDVFALVQIDVDRPPLVHPLEKVVQIVEEMVPNTLTISQGIASDVLSRHGIGKNRAIDLNGTRQVRNPPQVSQALQHSSLVSSGAAPYPAHGNSQE